MPGDYAARVLFRLIVIGALWPALAGGGVREAADTPPAPLLPEPLGDFDRYGAPQPKGARMQPKFEVVVAPRQIPDHPNKGADQIYPAASRALGEKGTVRLLLTVDAQGKVSGAKITDSSGYPRLDEAAQREPWRPGGLSPEPSTVHPPKCKCP